MSALLCSRLSGGSESLKEAEGFTAEGCLRAMDSVKIGIFGIMNTRAITKGANHTQDFLKEVG